jgi:hypothetical protein
MPIKNYTTEIPAMKSIGQIQGNLVAHGARAIMINFNESKEPDSLSFTIPTPHGEVPFRLPANVSAMQKVLDRQTQPKRYQWPDAIKARQEKLKEQAGRVAWRIIKDWVDAQLAIIETEMVTMEQVFLPYMTVKDGQSLYDYMNKKGYYLTEGQ